MRNFALVLSVAIVSISTSSSLLAQAVIEKQPIGQYVKTQLDAIAVPPSWQPHIGPGSIVFVLWMPRAGTRSVLGYTFMKKYVDNPVDDLPNEAKLPTGQITVAKFSDTTGTGVGFSLLVGKFAPSLKIGVASKIDYDQSSFSEKGWGSDGHITAAVLEKSTKLNSDLTDGVYDGTDVSGHRGWKGWGQGYLVTSVIYAEKVRISTNKQVEVDASLSALKDGECTAPKLQKDVSAPAGAGAPEQGEDASNSTASRTQKGTDVKSVAPTPQNGKSNKPSASAGNANQNSAEDPKAHTIFDDTISSLAASATIKFCRVKEDVYDLDIKPGIPVAFKAVELVYDYATGKPRPTEGREIDPGLKDLHDAMEHHD